MEITQHSVLETHHWRWKHTTDGVHKGMHEQHTVFGVRNTPLEVCCRRVHGYHTCSIQCQKHTADGVHKGMHGCHPTFGVRSTQLMVYTKGVHGCHTEFGVRSTQLMVYTKLRSAWIPHSIQCQKHTTEGGHQKSAWITCKTILIGTPTIKLSKKLLEHTK